MQHYTKPTITPKELFNMGLDSAVLWNIDRDKKLEIEVAIALSLKNGYHKSVIESLLNIFGKEAILNSIQKYENSLSSKLIENVQKSIKNHELVA